MFWGLIMEPRKRYTQTVEKPFHISMAALDISSKDDNEPTQIMATVEDRNYLLCTLQKGKCIQCPLDLNFNIGEDISFATNGKSHVHLTGYLVVDDFMDEEGDLEESDLEAEESEDETEETETGVKRKAQDTKGDKKKKLKASTLLDASMNSDDESDDSDINSDILNALEEGGEEEEEEDDSEEDDEDLDDEEMEELDAEEETIVPGKRIPKMMNGTSPKDNKNKQQLNESQNGTAKKSKKDKVETPTKPDSQSEKTPKSEKKKQKQENQKAPTPQKKVLEGGLIIEDIKVGDGQIAKNGKMLQVYYEGRLKSNNKMFDSSTNGKGFRFRLGQKEVIKGWDVGMNGMKVGGKRRIICPPNMAYGQKGSPPTIPANSTLVFEVELKNVK